MTPTEFKDWLQVLIAEGLRLVLALLVCIAVYLIFVGFAMAMQCKERPGDKSYWSYRIIDGQRCWYKGHRVVPKSRLEWPDEPKPKPIKGDPIFKIRADKSLPAPPDKNPAVMDADNGSSVDDPPTRRDTASTLAAVTWHMKRPFDEAKPIQPPLNLAVPDDPDVWPDLSEFERRFVGVQQ